MMLSEKGHGFLELLLSLALSSGVVLGLIALYIHVERSVQQQTEIMVVQEHARLAVNTLIQAIERAGQHHCLPFSTFDPKSAIHSLSVEEARTLWRVRILPESEAVELGSCLEFPEGARYVKTLYYLSNTSRKDANGQTVKALYQKQEGTRAQEVVPGIDQWTLRYGVMTADQKAIEAYLKRDQISNWESVGSIDWEWRFQGAESVHPSRFTWHVYAAIDSRLRG